jgi:hypothetical protein
LVKPSKNATANIRQISFNLIDTPNIGVRQIIARADNTSDGANVVIWVAYPNAQVEL